MEKTIKELTAKAEEFVREKGFNGLANHTLVKNWMAEFAVEHARDAVQAERSRLSKRYKSRLNRLRANDAETHRIQIEVKDERIAALQAKSAALVEALEEIKKVHGFAYTYGDGFSNVTDKRLNSTGVAIEKVIEAHKKGGVQG